MLKVRVYKSLQDFFHFWTEFNCSLIGPKRSSRVIDYLAMAISNWLWPKCICKNASSLKHIRYAIDHQSLVFNRHGNAFSSLYEILDWSSSVLPSSNRKAHNYSNSDSVSSMIQNLASVLDLTIGSCFCQHQEARVLPKFDTQFDFDNLWCL